MIRTTLAAATLALLAATNPGAAQYYNDGYAPQRQYGTYNSYQPTYRQPSYGYQQPTYRQPSYGYQQPAYNSYGYGRYGYGYR
jgi:hypothetical protein